MEKKNWNPKGHKNKKVETEPINFVDIIIIGL